jgi:hypothetical protein
LNLAKPKVPDKYEEPFLFCRTFGHNWRLGEGEPESVAFYRFVMICETCHARRIDVINRRTGSVGSRRYEYEDGYQTKGSALRRTVYRIEFVRRLDQ